MQVSQILSEYIKKYPIYGEVGFSFGSMHNDELLHPLLITTQYIIDSLIDKKEKRIAIVLPDNECNIIPIILTKYFSNVLYEHNYVGNILDDINPGQHLRLGKAVIEFCRIDKAKNTITYRVGKTDPCHVTCPIMSFHYLFEKTDGALSSWKTWSAERKNAEGKALNSSDECITAIKTKRTVLNKTMLLLTAKNDFKDYVDRLKVGRFDFSEIMSYGEIDADDEVGFNLFNKGRLDCIPALAISSKLEEIYYALKSPEILTQVYAIFSAIDKFEEVVSNIDTLKKCLRKDVPFIVFVPESAFAEYPILSELGFKMWHWKPSTMQSEAYLVGEYPTYKNNVFGNFSAKVDNAALAGFEIKRCINLKLKRNTRAIKDLSQLVIDADNSLRQLVRHIWAFHMRLVSALCAPSVRVVTQLTEEIDSIILEWQRQKPEYSGQPIVQAIDSILSSFSVMLSDGASEKNLELSSFLSDGTINGKTIVILVPDRYTFFDETKQTITDLCSPNRVQLKRMSDFLTAQEPYHAIDYLIVTWFDKEDYIRIKQTYCYGKLVYLLYDFENKWRDNFVSRFNSCLPHEAVKQSAAMVNISADFAEHPIDAPVVVALDDEEYKEIDDYETSRTIIRSTIKGGSAGFDGAESVDCIPVLLSGDHIAYFYPSHDVIDVTALANGDSASPVKKEASRLRKGDKILVRHSDRDIIKDKADALMATNNDTSLRALSARWSDTLQKYAHDRTIQAIGDAIVSKGGDCTYQQVRYWLSGETICPREIKIIECIAKIANDDELLQNMEHVFNAGQKVKSYHQRAGIWLSQALRDKASAIKTIIDGSADNIIEGIGAVSIYAVEEVLEKSYISRNKINRVEALY